MSAGLIVWGIAALAGVALGAGFWLYRRGLAAQRLEDEEATNRQQKEMLDAANNRPADRDELAERMRRGDF